MDRFIPEPEGQTQVVIAEDDPATLTLLKRQLEKAGFIVTACPDGQEALEAVRNMSEAILVADWGMPRMNGVELCRAVRELQSLNVIRSAHIILLTANSAQEQIVEGLEAGADDYLTKPYNKQELLARLRAGERTLGLLAELYNQKLEVQKANSTLQVLNDKLEKLANTDTLTNLFNRRVLFERLTESWDQSERMNTPMSCVMLDIDHFKAVNDTWGHNAGDAVLVEVAKMIRQNIRPYDYCARFGGEEFVVVSPGNHLHGAAVMAERLRAAVASTPITCDGNVISVSISLGVAEKSPRHDNFEALICEADAMLYSAKDNGRNQLWQVDIDGNQTQFAEAPAETA